MKRKIFLSIITFSVILALIVFFIVFRKSPDTVANEKEKFSVTAIELMDEFESDETAAMKKYGEQIIVVNGIVEQVEENKDGRIILMLKTQGMGNVSCLLGNGVSNSAKTGDGVQIKGSCTGYTIDVLLKQCLIIN